MPVAKLGGKFGRTIDGGIDLSAQSSLGFGERFGNGGDRYISDDH